MSFQKVVKQDGIRNLLTYSFRTVSFQKVVKPICDYWLSRLGFRTVSFQKVVKLMPFVVVALTLF